MDVSLKLTLDEVNSLLSVLGQLPTSSNAWPLMKKIRDQAEEDLKPREEAVEASEGA